MTGHGSQIAAMHRHRLERFDFDSVLLPYNFITTADPYYRRQLQLVIHGDVPLGMRPEADHPCRVGLAMLIEDGG